MQHLAQRPLAFIVAALGVFLIGAIWLGAKGTDPTDGNGGGSAPDSAGGAESTRTAGESGVENPMVTIEMENGAQIVIELYPDVAPNTVNNFVSLAKQGFYDGTIFHRVVPGFVIQGGDPTGTGRGGPGYTIKGEFTSNGFRNDLSHTRGVVSMARSSAPDSAGSQFFIVVADARGLDGDYAAFGKVVSGMEEVDRIVGVPRNAQDRPLEDQRIARVTVDEKGGSYPEPEKIVR